MKESALNSRNSSIELLKIIAIVGIVVSHVVQTLLIPEGGGNAAWRVDYSIATLDIGSWVLVFLRTLGAFGNSIFVVASSWFLAADDSVKSKKIAHILIDVFVISIVILLVCIPIGIRPDAKTLIKCVLPTTFCNNWFVTSYLMLYAIHACLNRMYDSIGKRHHAFLCLGLITFYMFIPMFTPGLFFSTEFIVMVSMYTVVAYLRRYASSWINNRAFNAKLVLCGLCATCFLIMLLEIAGVHFGFLADKMLHFDFDGNPFLFIASVGLFNLARLNPFSCSAINALSSTSLYVYLIHENLLVRQFIRPAIWTYIYDAFGYMFLFFWIAVLSIFIFTVSVLLSLLYLNTLGIKIDRVSQAATECLSRLSSGICR